MPPGPTPSTSPASATAVRYLTTPTAPQPVVEAFLDALVSPDLERVGELLSPDVVYSNVGLPTLRGRDAVVRAIGFLDRPRASFEVFVHAITTTGQTVLTERTDAIGYGRYRAQFWVTGRFDVVDGLITLWRDSFDFLDVLRGSLRGVGALVSPQLGPAMPCRRDVPPGRHAGRHR